MKAKKERRGEIGHNEFPDSGQFRNVSDHVLLKIAGKQLQHNRKKCETAFGPGLRSRISNNTGSRSRIFCPTPEVQLDHFLHHTPKLGIPVEMEIVVQFLLKLLLKQISCCAPRFPLILTDKFHSLYVKGSEIWEVGVGYFTSDSATLVWMRLGVNFEAPGHASRFAWVITVRLPLTQKSAVL